MNTYQTIVPSQMTNHELRGICADIQIAKNWGQKTVRVKLPYSEYDVSIDQHKDYQNQLNITSYNSEMDKQIRIARGEKF